MDIKAFYNDYNLEEIDVLRIFNNGDKVSILLGLPVNLELIANGCRPEFNLYYKHLFTFQDDNLDIDISNPKITNYRFEDNSIIFSILDKSYTLKSNRVSVKMNYE